jgi:hypothetical protein
MTRAAVFRRANVSRISGHWQDEDFDVFDGERDVGRIFQQADGQWFWGPVVPAHRPQELWARGFVRGGQGGVPR